jgi:hypothetical protein
MNFPSCDVGPGAQAALLGAREKVRVATVRLEEVKSGLQEIVDAFDVPLVPGGEEEDLSAFQLAGACEMDALIRCGIHDHLNPLLETLRSLVRAEPEEAR